MTKVIDKKTPNGVVPISQISDLRIRDVLMKIIENISALAKQVSALTKAVQELQRK